MTPDIDPHDIARAVNMMGWLKAPDDQRDVIVAAACTALAQLMSERGESSPATIQLAQLAIDIGIHTETVIPPLIVATLPALGLRSDEPWMEPREDFARDTVDALIERVKRERS
jgi:hypothetical protein